MSTHQVQAECADCGRQGTLPGSHYWLNDIIFCRLCLQRMQEAGWVEFWIYQPTELDYQLWRHPAPPGTYTRYQLTAAGCEALPALREVAICSHSGNPIYQHEVDAGTARLGEEPACSSCVMVLNDMMKSTDWRDE